MASRGNSTLLLTLGEAHVEKMVRLSWSPSIVLLPGFISEEVCDVGPRPHSLVPSDYHSRLCF